MSGLVTAIPTAITAFIATNIDDFIILLVFFSQVNVKLRVRHIVAGQYLGLAALTLASLPGFLSRLILPQQWIGLLGLLPIAIGLTYWLNRNSQEFEVEPVVEQWETSTATRLISPQTYTVAAVTIANGSDNIGIYVPLFSHGHFVQLWVTIGVFFLLAAIWLYTAYKITNQSAIAPLLTRYGNLLVPFVLNGLGIFIVLDSHALTPLALAASCLCLIGIIKNYEDSSETANHLSRLEE